MNPLSLPRATLFTIGALAVALVGWGVLIYTTVSYNNAEERWAKGRSALGDRVAELEATLDEERKAAGDWRR